MKAAAIAPVTNIVIAGLGGQGVLTASDILADVAFASGLDVKKSEVHGMSQRGGSVASDVRFGDCVLSPMVPPGEAEYLLVIAADQVNANRHHLREGCVPIEPASLDTDAPRNTRSMNVALLGVLSAHLAFGETDWIAAVRRHLPKKLHAVNEQAFKQGREIGRRRSAAGI